MNREIHQSVPDHRVKLTPEGWDQAEDAGRRLRAMLRPDDKIHFFTSPYRRTRETTEGILSTLTSDNPSPSPYRRSQINVYEEPRLREQDFGNFQPCTAAMERMWQERADYGHFFYRIPNGESAADAYDRVSGFNESLWRLFGEDDFASVCVLVTHGLMTRIFLMKWYHFSVEYFEDLRNVNHCEFVVMKKGADNGKYILQNQLRTWSELEKEQEREWAEKHGVQVGDIKRPSSPPIRRKWGGCVDGCNHRLIRDWRKPPVRRNTADLYRDDEEAVDSGSPGSTYHESKSVDTNRTRHFAAIEVSSTSSGKAGSGKSGAGDKNNKPAKTTATATTQTTSTTRTNNEEPLNQRLTTLRAGLQGRDGGGSQSGMASRACSDDEGDQEEAEQAVEKTHGGGHQHKPVVASMLGDSDDEFTPLQHTATQTDEEAVVDAPEPWLETEKERDQSFEGSVY